MNAAEAEEVVGATVSLYDIFVSLSGCLERASASSVAVMGVGCAGVGRFGN